VSRCGLHQAAADERARGGAARATRVVLCQAAVEGRKPGDRRAHRTRPRSGRAGVGNSETGARWTPGDIADGGRPGRGEVAYARPAGRARAAARPAGCGSGRPLPPQLCTWRRRRLQVLLRAWQQRRSCLGSSDDFQRCFELRAGSSRARRRRQPPRCSVLGTRRQSCGDGDGDFKPCFMLSGSGGRASSAATTFSAASSFAPAAAVW
jgi:hypothetical protein